MKRVLAIVKWVFVVWGGLSALITVVFAGLLMYRLGIGNRTKTDVVSPQDVRFVLNWCNLGHARLEKVVQSYVSSRSFTGDHLDAYAIQITAVTVDELVAREHDFQGRWYRGDQLPKVLDDAVAFVGGWHHEIAWFPTEAELRSQEIYIYPWSIDFHGVRPTAAKIIFVRPKDKMVFYFDGKT